MPNETQGSPKQGGSNNTALIVVIVILVILILGGLAGCGCWYMYKKAKESTVIVPTTQPTATVTSSATSSTTSTSTTTTSDFEVPPSDVVKDFLWYTVGTITGSSLDTEAAKDLVSYELAQQLDDSAFIPQALCIQQGPDEISVYDETTDSSNMESYVQINANWGGDWQVPWEFELINGEGGWKIKSITCLDTGQVTQ